MIIRREETDQISLAERKLTVHRFAYSFFLSGLCISDKITNGSCFMKISNDIKIELGHRSVLNESTGYESNKQEVKERKEKKER